jgi:hypothetical protein
VAPLAAVGPTRGEIVAFDDCERGIVSHRVLGVRCRGDDSLIVTRGDNEAGPGEEVAASAVVGRVAARERAGRVVPLAGWRSRAWRLWVLGGRLRVVGRGFARAGARRDAGPLEELLAGLSRVEPLLRPGLLDELARLGDGEARGGPVAGVGAGSDSGRDRTDQIAHLRAQLWRHRIAPWASLHLPEETPAWLATVVADEAIWWRATCVLRLAVCERTLQRLAGIPVVVLKGPAYAGMLYGSAQGRPFHDLDLMIAPSRVADAIEALRADGWEHRPRRRFRWQRKATDHALIRDPADGLARVELHTTLVDKPEFAPGLARRPEAAFEETVQATVCGEPCLVLSPEATLLHALLHWHLHSYAGLGWGLDVALASRRDLDWDRVVELAAEWQIRHITWLGLRMATREHGAVVPPAALSRLGRPGLAARLAFLRLSAKPAASRRERTRTIEQVAVYVVRDSALRSLGALTLLPARWAAWEPDVSGAR